MKVGLSYDLKDAVGIKQDQAEDALEEYDSLETVEAIARVLKDNGHSVVKLGGGREFLNNILHENVDIVFNIAEGLGNYRSREAQVPSVLEMLDIPYSGSDPQCLAICLDKPLTNQLVAMAGVCTPRRQIITHRHQLKEIDWNNFPFPVFLKPVHEGSSMGIRSGSRLDNARQLAEVAQTLLERYRQPVMVEEFIVGDEVTVGITGNTPPEVLGIMHIVSQKKDRYFVYSLEVKRDWENLVDYECPARFEPNVLQKIADSSLKAFEVLGCRDIARLDFRLSRDGTPYFLEINPLPGLNPKSGDIVIMAKKMGWTYPRLISTIVGAAIERYPQCARR